MEIYSILTDDQFSFWNGWGTHEVILALKIIVGKWLDKDKDAFTAFVGIGKAFENVKWEKNAWGIKETRK